MKRNRDGHDKLKKTSRQTDRRTNRAECMNQGKYDRPGEKDRNRRTEI